MNFQVHMLRGDVRSFLVRCVLWLVKQEIAEVCSFKLEIYARRQFELLLWHKFVHFTSFGILEAGSFFWDEEKVQGILISKFA
jgi:hypothetical protein